MFYVRALLSTVFTLIRTKFILCCYNASHFAHPTTHPLLYYVLSFLLFLACYNNFLTVPRIDKLSKLHITD